MSGNSPVYIGAGSSQLAVSSALTIIENAVEIASIVKPIMQRYIGENPMSESEMELATFLNDCILIKEVESGSTAPIEAMHIEDNLPLHRERTTPGSDRNDQ